MTPIFRLLVMAITFTAAAATHPSRGPECAQVTQTLATSLCQVSDLCHVNHRAECFPESSSHWDPYLNGVSPDDSQLGVALRCAPCDAGIQSTSNAPSDVYEICPVSLGQQSQAVLIRAKRTQQQTGLVDSNLNHNFVLHEYHPFCSQFLPCSSLRTGEDCTAAIAMLRDSPMFRPQCDPICSIPLLGIRLTMLAMNIPLGMIQVQCSVVISLPVVRPLSQVQVVVLHPRIHSSSK